MLECRIFEIGGTESLVPAEHLLRKIDAAVDFNKIYDMAEPLYCTDNGRPSVDPVVLISDDSVYKRPQTVKGGHEWWKYVSTARPDIFAQRARTFCFPRNERVQWGNKEHPLVWYHLQLLGNCGMLTPWTFVRK